jgi:glycosyltransferase involved in cell wall biosynthesis
MDKLTVGIILEKGYIPTTGGGYSYYDMLIQYIDKYAFNERLNIVFIQLTNEKIQFVNKQVVQINPLKFYGKFYKLVDSFVDICLKPFIRTSRFIRRFYNGIYSFHFTIHNRYIEQVLVEHKVDILYYLTPGTKGNINYPFILTHWDNGHVSMFAFPEVAMSRHYKYRQHYYGTVGKAFAIFCESVAGKYELIKYTNLNPDRIFVVPLFPGVVVETALSPDTQQIILNQHQLVSRQFFFYPAQFWAHKNHYNLLVAFQIISEVYPHLKLVFTGSDKGNLDYIKEVIHHLKLESKVVLSGFVDNDTLYTLYKNANALVMPTFLGPTNIPLLEAQALGCPVICSNLVGHKEMLGEAACYIDPDNPISISEAMLLNLQNNISPPPFKNPVFCIENAMRQIENNLLILISKRKAFGFNYP